jgi:hypothetical protein
MDITLNKSSDAEIEAKLQMMKLLSGAASSPKEDVRSSLENEDSHDKPQKAAHVNLDEDVPMTFPQRVSQSMCL